MEFDFSIFYAFVIFPFLRIINKTMSGETCTPPTHLKLIYIIPNTLFSQNLTIIITGTFRNTPFPLKLHKIILFPTDSSAYQIIILFVKALIHYYPDYACHGLNFHLRDMKFSDIVPNTITIMH